MGQKKRQRTLDYRATQIGLATAQEINESVQRHEFKKLLKTGKIRSCREDQVDALRLCI